MLQRYFVVLTKTQEEPYRIEDGLTNKVIILKEIHPTPDSIRETFKANPLFSFAFLYKGIFSELTNTSFVIETKQLIRKYNCSSFGLSERQCKGYNDVRTQRVY